MATAIPYFILDKMSIFLMSEKGVLAIKNSCQLAHKSGHSRPCFKIYVDVGGDPIGRTQAYRFWHHNTTPHHNKPRELFFSSVFVLGDMPDTQINA